MKAAMPMTGQNESAPNLRGRCFAGSPVVDGAIVERRHIHKRDGSVQVLELVDAAGARGFERALRIIAEDCEAWLAAPPLRSEKFSSDACMLKRVAWYAREVLSAPVGGGRELLKAGMESEVAK